MHAHFALHFYVARTHKTAVYCTVNRNNVKILYHEHYLFEHTNKLLILRPTIVGKYDHQIFLVINYQELHYNCHHGYFNQLTMHAVDAHLFRWRISGELVIIDT